MLHSQGCFFGLIGLVIAWSHFTRALASYLILAWKANHKIQARVIYFRQAKVPKAVIDLMEKPPHTRTNDDLYTISSLMMDLPSFRKYTKEMQTMMCRIVRYMKLVLLAVCEWVDSTDPSMPLNILADVEKDGLFSAKVIWVILCTSSSLGVCQLFWTKMRKAYL